MPNTTDRPSGVPGLVTKAPLPPMRKTTPRVFRYEVTNQSAAGGSIEFPITTEVAFDDLVLVQTRQDGFEERLELCDADGKPVTSLGSGDLFLDSEPVAAYDPDHGRVVLAVLTGRLRAQTVEILMMAGKPLVEATIDPNLRSQLNLADADAFTAILAHDAMGIMYPAGTFGIVAARI